MVKQQDAIKTHTTGGMSGNSAGSIYSSRSFLGDSYSAFGNMFYEMEYTPNSNGLGWSSSAPQQSCKVSNNIAHTHTYSGDVETRPQNYTIKVWKRVS